ncbi:unnamed protein product [Paramecium pentaurelia]|uniref:Uncharacterized protein n=1 Tax=Paramecium pentaurelia TaxID=43138 RepID=A0A8S1XY36_9CILI|nr:unnamed protein product [Paramecium pentaurelia]
MQNFDHLIPVSIQLVDGGNKRIVLYQKFDLSTQFNAIENQMRQYLRLNPEYGIQLTVDGQKKADHVKLSQISNINLRREIEISMKILY